jgi:hypothetical protein
VCGGDCQESDAPVSKQVLETYIYTTTLLAILCLMRYEDWTFRETEVRLQEHSELRMALSLKQTPHYTTFYRFMRRLNTALIQTALQETAFQTMKDSSTKRAVLAVDATGLAPGAISTFFINRKRDRGCGNKTPAVVGPDRQTRSLQ